MSVTIIIGKLHLAIAVFAIAVLAPATAMAVDSWSDTEDGEFYHEAVTWAKGNGMTVGCDGGAGFCPDRNVTRGENITFAHRYDTSVVQPALTTLTTETATNTSDIAGLDRAQAFAVTTHVGNVLHLVGAPITTVTVTVTAQIAGHVTVSSTAMVIHSSDGGDVLCVIVESTDIPGFIADLDESAQWHEASSSNGRGSLSGTRTFTIAAGASITYVLACQEFADGGIIYGRNLTAIFTPAS